jgi:hypothetical protein
VPEDRSVLHEAVLPEDELASSDIVPREEHGPVGGNDGAGDRWMVLVDAVGEIAEDPEPDHEGEDRHLHPGGRDEQLRAVGVAHARLS